jgi:hypothetical protein
MTLIAWLRMSVPHGFYFQLLALYDSPRRAADRQVTFDLRVGREETSLVMAFFHFLLVAQLSLFDQILGIIVRAPVLHVQGLCQHIDVFVW